LGSILISESVANSGVSILLHTAVEPHSVITAARNEIRKLDLAVYRVQTLEELIGGSTSDRQFSMLLFAAFAGLAVLLAAAVCMGLSRMRSRNGRPRLVSGWRWRRRIRR